MVNTVVLRDECLQRWLASCPDTRLTLFESIDDLVPASAYCKATRLVLMPSGSDQLQKKVFNPFRLSDRAY